MRCAACVWGKMKKVLNELNEFIVLGLFIGLLGGLGRAIHCDEHDFSWLRFCYRIISAAFVSVMAGLIMTNMDYPPMIEAAIIGGCGYAAVDILKAVPGVVKRKAEKL